MSFDGSKGPPNIDGMTSLKVDNLTYRTGIDQLKSVFGKYGDIGDIYIPRDRKHLQSRGFAFIRFWEKRDAEDAMDLLDKSILDGREIRVQMARYGRPTETYKPRPRNNYRDSRRSYRSRSRSRSPKRRGRYSRSKSRSPRRRYSRSRSPRRNRSRSPSPRRSRSPPPRRSRSRSGSPANRRSRSRTPPRRSRSSSPIRSDSRSPRNENNDSSNYAHGAMNKDD